MTSPTTSSNKVGWRYSPLPRNQYGPFAASSLLTSEAAWNLAWLSHDYEGRKGPNAKFTTAVRSTLAVCTDTGDIDVLGLENPVLRLSNFMTFPPDIAIAAIHASPFFTKMPLHQLLGAKWKDIMISRVLASRRKDPAAELNKCIDAPVGSVVSAATLLMQFQRKS